MINKTKDILLTVLPLLLYYTFSQYEAKYNVWQLHLQLSKCAKNRREKNGLNGQQLVKESATNSFVECFV